MSTKENRSIAYIYNEMDPSEKLEFERDLENDSDLLIEVESFKKVSNDLKGLQQIEPPAYIVDAICKSAQRNSVNSNTNYWRTFLYSAAAVVFIGMTSGIFLMNDQSAENESQAESASVAGTPILSQPVKASSEESLSPWVDKNDILYFQEQMESRNQAFLDSIKNDSYKKLTPVNPSQARPHQRLQLTGSRN